MQWVLQDFEDTRKLAETLDRAGLRHSWHKVVPFVGALEPEPEIADPSDAILFGSYALRHFATAHRLKPGVFTIGPYLHEVVWQAHLLNGPGAILLRLSEVEGQIAPGETAYFMRPVDDSKAEPGRVRRADELRALAAQVCALDPDDIPGGSLRPDTELMLCQPKRIHAEWRTWVVGDRVVTHSLYKQGARVIYRPEIDPDALDFARALVAANPGYAPAYTLDICRTEDGLHLLETNCVNAAGFYAADLQKLVGALEELAHGG